MKFSVKGVIVVIIVFILLYQDFLQAHGISNIFSHIHASSKTILSGLNIPEDLGRINQMWLSSAKKSSSKTVIHIQDSHAHYQAQKNIAGILESLINSHPDKKILVAAEGAAGDIDTGIFREFENLEVKRLMTERLLKEGIMTGADLFSSFYVPDNYVYWGVEDKDVYLRNLEIFRRLQRNKEGAKKYIARQKNKLDQRIQGVMNSEQIEFLEQLYKYHNDQIGLEEYISYLNFKIQILESQINHRSASMNFIRLVCLIKIKNLIDFSEVDKERMELLKCLKAKLTEEDLIALIAKGMEYHAGRVSAKSYFGGLRRHLLRDKKFWNLRLYAEYVLLESAINRNELFNELDKIEGEIQERLFADTKSRLLAGQFLELTIIRKFLDLRIYRDDILYYKEHKEDFNKYRLQYLDIFYNFCRIGIARDKVLVDNMLKKTEEIDADIAILITGGFHTEGMTRLMQDKDISYAVISPRITEPGDKNRYISIMMNDNSAYQKVLFFRGKRLAPMNRFCRNLCAVTTEFYQDLYNRLLIAKGDFNRNNILEEIFGLQDKLKREQDPMDIKIYLGGKVLSVVEKIFSRYDRKNAINVFLLLITSLFLEDTSLLLSVFCITSSNGDWEELRESARKHISSKEWQEAKECLEKAVSKENVPELEKGRMLYSLATVDSNLGNIDEAVIKYIESKKILGEYAPLELALGSLYLIKTIIAEFRNDNKAADELRAKSIEASRKALKLDLDNKGKTMAKYNLAVALGTSNKKDYIAEAIKILEESIKGHKTYFGEEFFEGYKHLGVFYWEYEKYTDTPEDAKKYKKIALEKWGKAYEINKNDIGLLMYFVFTFLHLRDTEKASNYLKQAFEKDLSHRRIYESILENFRINEEVYPDELITNAKWLFLQYFWQDKKTVHETFVQVFNDLTFNKQAVIEILYDLVLGHDVNSRIKTNLLTVIVDLKVVIPSIVPLIIEDLRRLFGNVLKIAKNTGYKKERIVTTKLEQFILSLKQIWDKKLIEEQLLPFIEKEALEHPIAASGKGNEDIRTYIRGLLERVRDELKVNLELVSDEQEEAAEKEAIGEKFGTTNEETLEVILNAIRTLKKELNWPEDKFERLIDRFAETFIRLKEGHSKALLASFLVDYIAKMDDKTRERALNEGLGIANFNQLLISALDKAFPDKLTQSIKWKIVSICNKKSWKWEEVKGLINSMISYNEGLFSHSSEFFKISNIIEKAEKPEDVIKKLEEYAESTCIKPDGNIVLGDWTKQDEEKLHEEFRDLIEDPEYDLSGNYFVKLYISQLRRIIQSIPKNEIALPNWLSLRKRLISLLDNPKLRLFFLKPKSGHDKFYFQSNFAEAHFGHNKTTGPGREENVYIASPAFNKKTAGGQLGLIAHELVHLILGRGDTVHKIALNLEDEIHFRFDQGMSLRTPVKSNKSSRGLLAVLNNFTNKITGDKITDKILIGAVYAIYKENMDSLAEFAQSGLLGNSGLKLLDKLGLKKDSMSADELTEIYKAILLVRDILKVDRMKDYLSLVMRYLATGRIKKAEKFVLGTQHWVKEDDTVELLWIYFLIGRYLWDSLNSKNAQYVLEDSDLYFYINEVVQWKDKADSLDLAQSEKEEFKNMINEAQALLEIIELFCNILLGENRKDTWVKLKLMNKPDPAKENIVKRIIYPEIFTLDFVIEANKPYLYIRPLYSKKGQKKYPLDKVIDIWFYKNHIVLIFKDNKNVIKQLSFIRSKGAIKRTDVSKVIPLGFAGYYTYLKDWTEAEVPLLYCFYLIDRGTPNEAIKIYEDLFKRNLSVAQKERLLDRFIIFLLQANFNWKGYVNILDKLAGTIYLDKEYKSDQHADILFMLAKYFVLKEGDLAKAKESLDKAAKLDSMLKIELKEYLKMIKIIGKLKEIRGKLIKPEIVKAGATFIPIVIELGKLKIEFDTVDSIKINAEVQISLKNLLWLKVDRERIYVSYREINKIQTRSFAVIGKINKEDTLWFKNGELISPEMSVNILLDILCGNQDDSFNVEFESYKRQKVLGTKKTFPAKGTYIITNKKTGAKTPPFDDGDLHKIALGKGETTLSEKIFKVILSEEDKRWEEAMLLYNSHKEGYKKVSEINEGIRLLASDWQNREKQDQAIDLLIQAVDSESTRSTAEKCLIKKGKPAVSRILKTLFLKESGDIQFYQLIDVLGKIKDEDSIAPLVELFCEKSFGKKQIGSALKEIGHPKAVDMMLQLIVEENRRDKENYDVLCRIGYLNIKSILRAWAKSDGELKIYLLEIIARIDPILARGALIISLPDDSEDKEQIEKIKKMLENLESNENWKYKLSKEDKMLLKEIASCLFSVDRLYLYSEVASWLIRAGVADIESFCGLIRQASEKKSQQLLLNAMQESKYERDVDFIAFLLDSLEYYPEDYIACVLGEPTAVFLQGLDISQKLTYQELTATRLFWHRKNPKKLMQAKRDIETTRDRLGKDLFKWAVQEIGFKEIINKIDLRELVEVTIGQKLKIMVHPYLIPLMAETIPDAEISGKLYSLGSYTKLTYSLYSEKRELLKLFKGCNFAARLALDVDEFDKYTIKQLISKTADLYESYKKLYPDDLQLKEIDRVWGEVKAKSIELTENAGTIGKEPTQRNLITGLSYDGEIGSVKTIHEFINFIHQRGLNIKGRLMQKPLGPGLLEENKNFTTIVFGGNKEVLYRQEHGLIIFSRKKDAPVYDLPPEVRYCLNNILTVFLMSYKNRLAGYTIESYNSELDIYLPLGEHTSNLHVDFLCPQDGGKIVVDWNEGNVGWGNMKRQELIGTSLVKIGYELRNSIFYCDSDSGISTVKDIMEVLSKTLELLLPTKGVDLIFDEVGVDVSHETMSNTDVIWQLGFDNYRMMLYDANFTKDSIRLLSELEDILRDKLNSVLRDLWFPEIPDNCLFGVHSIDFYVNKQIERSLEMGQIVYNEDSQIIKNPDYSAQSQVRTFAKLLQLQNPEAIDSLMIIAEIYHDVLKAAAGETAIIGSINGYYIKRLVLDYPGRTLAFWGLYHRSGQALAAYCARGDCVYEFRESAGGSVLDNIIISPKEILKLLSGQNIRLKGTRRYKTGSDELVIKRKALEETLRRKQFVPLADPGAQARIFGIKISPGLVTGPAVFNTEGRNPGDFAGNILVSKAIAPRDLPKMQRAEGLVITSGGPLTHIGILWRELGKPGILMEGQWIKDEKKQNLCLKYDDFISIQEKADALEIVRRLNIRSKTAFISEGDILTVDGTDGILYSWGHRESILKAWEMINNIGRGNDNVSWQELLELTEQTSEVLVLRFLMQEIFTGNLSDKLEADKKELFLNVLSRNKDIGEKGRRYLERIADAQRKELSVLVHENSRIISKATYPRQIKLLEQKVENRVKDLLTFHKILGKKLPQEFKKRLKTLELIIRNRYLKLSGIVESRLKKCYGHCLNMDRLSNEKLSKLRNLLREVIFLRDCQGKGVNLKKYKKISDFIEYWEEEKHKSAKRHENRYILFLDEMDIYSEPYTGAKAANLGEIAKLIGKEHILMGFSVTDKAFYRFMNFNDMWSKIEKIRTMDIDENKRYELVKQEFIDAEWPKRLKTLIIRSYRKLEKYLSAEKKLDILINIINRAKLDLGDEGVKLLIGIVSREREANQKSWERSTLGEIIHSLPIDSEALKEKLLESLHLTGAFVAIRSSAVKSEGSKDASFAGEMNTYLYCNGEEVVLDRIKMCMASLWSSRANLYRKHFEYKQTDLHYSVFIQIMVDAESSAVASSIDPANDDWDKITLNAVYGLGEGMMGYGINTDLFVIDKKPDKYGLGITIMPREKEQMCVHDYEKGHGTILVDVEKEKRDKAVLNEAELEECRRKITKLENYWNWPRTIELAKTRDGTIMILQDQPVTAISGGNEKETPKAVIPSLRSNFPAEYQGKGSKGGIYENEIAPIVEEYGLWLGVWILRALGNGESATVKEVLERVKKQKGVSKYLYVLGFRTIFILLSLIQAVFSVFLFHFPLYTRIISVIGYGSILLHVLHHRRITNKSGALVMGVLIAEMLSTITVFIYSLSAVNADLLLHADNLLLGLRFILISYMSILISNIITLCILLIFSIPGIIHLLWNKIMPEWYKSVSDSDTMRKFIRIITACKEQGENIRRIFKVYLKNKECTLAVIKHLAEGAKEIEGLSDDKLVKDEAVHLLYLGQFGENERNVISAILKMKKKSNVIAYVMESLVLMDLEKAAKLVKGSFGEEPWIYYLIGRYCWGVLNEENISRYLRFSYLYLSKIILNRHIIREDDPLLESEEEIKNEAGCLIDVIMLFSLVFAKSRKDTYSKMRIVNPAENAGSETEARLIDLLSGEQQQGKAVPETSNMLKRLIHPAGITIDFVQKRNKVFLYFGQKEYRDEPYRFTIPLDRVLDIYFCENKIDVLYINNKIKAAEFVIVNGFLRWRSKNLDWLADVSLNRLLYMKITTNGIHVVFRNKEGKIEEKYYGITEGTGKPKKNLWFCDGKLFCGSKDRQRVADYLTDIFWGYPHKLLRCAGLLNDSGNGYIIENTNSGKIWKSSEEIVYGYVLGRYKLPYYDSFKGYIEKQRLQMDSKPHGKNRRELFPEILLGLGEETNWAFYKKSDFLNMPVDGEVNTDWFKGIIKIVPELVLRNIVRNRSWDAEKLFSYLDKMNIKISLSEKEILRDFVKRSVESVDIFALDVEYLLQLPPEIKNRILDKLVRDNADKGALVFVSKDLNKTTEDIRDELKINNLSEEHIVTREVLDLERKEGESYRDTLYKIISNRLTGGRLCNILLFADEENAGFYDNIAVYTSNLMLIVLGKNIGGIQEGRMLMLEYLTAMNNAGVKPEEAIRLIYNRIGYASEEINSIISKVLRKGAISMDEMPKLKVEDDIFVALEEDASLREEL